MWPVYFFFPVIRQENEWQTRRGGRVLLRDNGYTKFGDFLFVETDFSARTTKQLGLINNYRAHGSITCCSRSPTPSGRGQFYVIRHILTSLQADVSGPVTTGRIGCSDNVQNVNSCPVSDNTVSAAGGGEGIEMWERRVRQLASSESLPPTDAVSGPSYDDNHGGLV